MVNLQTYYYTKTQIDTLLNGKATTNHSHGNISNTGTLSGTSQNVVTDSNGVITTEAKPTIPTKTSDLTNDSNYVTTSDSRLSDARTPTSHTHGNISNGGAIGTDSGKIITTGTNGVLTASDSITKSLISDFPSSMTPTSHEHNTGEVKDTSAYSNIGSSANSTQKTINDKINTKLGEKAVANNVYTKTETYTQSEITTAISNAVSDLQLFEVVESLPTTNIKSNRLYLIVNGESITNNSYDIYLRVNNSWEQLDSLEFDISNFYNKTEVDTLLNGKVDTSDSRLTDTRTPKSHTHGNITNTGTLSGKSKNVVTDSNGAITTEDKPTIPTKTSDLNNDGDGTSGVTYVKSNDSRLTDARTPTTHSHTKSQITDFPTLSTVATSGSYNDLTNKPSIPTKTSDLTNDADGTSGVTYVKSNDSRLSDARTPTSHTHTKSQITDFPTIPSASSTTPSADTTSGSYGSGTDYARANHTHPKSSLYAEASHNQASSTIIDMGTVDILVTYSDNSTETLTLFKEIVYTIILIDNSMYETEIVVSVYDSANNPTSNIGVDLYVDGVKVKTKTTNNNGVVGFTYSDGGGISGIHNVQAKVGSSESNIESINFRE